MGGAIFAQGNSWEPAAEFNFNTDPEAAAAVFDRWPGFTLVPWETSQANDLPAELVQALAAGTSPRAALFHRTIQKRLAGPDAEHQVLPEPDPLALAVALEPDIVRRAEPRFIQIELSGRLTRGQTVVDWQDLAGRAPNVEVVLEIDRERYWRLLRQTFA
jgi:purine nucleosidase